MFNHGINIPLETKLLSLIWKLTSKQKDNDPNYKTFIDYFVEIQKAEKKKQKKKPTARPFYPLCSSNKSDKSQCENQMLLILIPCWDVEQLKQLWTFTF